MSLRSTHPQFNLFFNRWSLCIDAHAGQDVVKAQAEKYLRPTRGMELDGLNQGQQGRTRYEGYLDRAVFPEVFTDTVNVLVGIMNRKPPAIQLPAIMEDMREKATILGESLNDVIRKIHEQQLITGRLGIHLDVPVEEVQAPNMLPVISMFNALTIRNWDDGEELDPTRQTLNLIVLDASEFVRTQFEWDLIQKYRVLQLGSFEDNEATGVYMNGLFDEENVFNESEMNTPRLRGNTIDEIPFVFIGPKDININPDLPPMLGLANRSMAIYKGEADLRQALHISSCRTMIRCASVQAPASPWHRMEMPSSSAPTAGRSSSKRTT